MNWQLALIMVLVFLLVLLVFLGWLRFQRKKSLTLRPEDLSALIKEVEASPQNMAWLADMTETSGWSRGALMGVLVRQQDLEGRVDLDFLSQDMQVFGSWSFSLLTLLESGLGRPPEEILGQVLAILDFRNPLDRTGRAQLERMADLEPDSPYWGFLAGLVDQAFPGDSLSQPSGLGRQVHQLRYVISYQQADWIRRHYGGVGVSDRQALITYLATKNRRNSLLEHLGLLPSDYSVYDLRESARLHNKLAFDYKGRVQAWEALPNVKILLNFHTEFILDAQGNFANVLGEDLSNQNGLINGASFNYASRNNRRHRQLDVAPVASHDPRYRLKALRGTDMVYRSPKSAQIWQRRSWLESYANPRGLYAYQGRSLKAQVLREARRLSRDIRRFQKQD